MAAQRHRVPCGGEFTRCDKKMHLIIQNQLHVQFTIMERKCIFLSKGKNEIIRVSKS